MSTLTTEIKDFVRAQKLGFIATVCPDGTPNLSPKGTTTVWDDHHLMFADIHSPGTVENLVSNPSIEINIVDVFARKGYRFKGVAKIVSQGEVFEQAIASYGDAAGKYKIHHIVLVKVSRILEITSPIYDTGLSADEVINRWSEYWESIHPKTGLSK